MKIIEFIPYGHDNGVTTKELAHLLNIDNRTVRLEISKARQEDLILNMQDGKGYFRPDDDEVDLVEHWVNQEKCRRKAITQNLRLAQKYLCPE